MNGKAQALRERATGYNPNERKSKRELRNQERQEKREAKQKEKDAKRAEKNRQRAEKRQANKEKRAKFWGGVKDSFVGSVKGTFSRIDNVITNVDDGIHNVLPFKDTRDKAWDKFAGGMQNMVDTGIYKLYQMDDLAGESASRGFDAIFKNTTRERKVTNPMEKAAKQVADQIKAAKETVAKVEEQRLKIAQQFRDAELKRNEYGEKIKDYDQDSTEYDLFNDKANLEQERMTSLEAVLGSMNTQIDLMNENITLLEDSLEKSNAELVNTKQKLEDIRDERSQNFIKFGKVRGFLARKRKEISTKLEKGVLPDPSVRESREPDTSDVDVSNDTAQTEYISEDFSKRTKSLNDFLSNPK